MARRYGVDNRLFFFALTGCIRVKSSRLWRECRGEACLARHVRRTRIADIAIIHFKTSFVGYRGRGMTHIYRSLACFIRDFVALTGRIYRGTCKIPQGVALG